jgi:5,10-methylenetetrahydromethanopterin reductase
MKVGLFLGDARTIDQQVDQIIKAEQDGFDSAWLPQIFMMDAMTAIAVAGQKTQRIEMGTSVVPVYLRHPFGFAQQAVTVQAAAGGRFVAGIGLSHAPVIEMMWGLSYAKPAAYMREYLSVSLPLMREGKVSFAGDHFRVNANLVSPAEKPPGVMIAALAPAMLRTAGELTDGTITWMTGPKTVETHVLPRITRAASEAGRPAPRVAVGLPIAVTDDADAARERVAQLFQVYGTLPNYKRMLDKEGAEGPKDVAIVGNEVEVERQIRGLASAGATDLLASIFPFGDDPAKAMARTYELVKGLVGKV